MSVCDANVIHRGANARFEVNRQDGDPIPGNTHAGHWCTVFDRTGVAASMSNASFFISAPVEIFIW